MKRTYRIVWAEDIAESFENYKQILMKFATGAELDLEILWARDGNEIYKFLLDRTSLPDLLVVDLAMPAWNGLDTVKDLSVKLPHLPKIVISTRTKEDDQFRVDLQEILDRGFIRGFYAVEPSSLWCQAIAAVLTLTEPRILHISDLHFGAAHAFKGKWDLEELCGLFFDQLEEGKRPNLIVVSGDLADRGVTSDFERACGFLRKLSTLMRVGPEDVVFVPGNHDVFRGEEPSARLNKYLEAIEQWYGWSPEGLEALENYPLLYQKPSSLLKGKKNRMLEDTLFAVHVYDKYRLVIVAMNSVITDDERIEWGEISLRQLLAVRTALASLTGRQSDYTRIAVFHHHLFPVPSFVSDGEPDRVLRKQAVVLRFLASLQIQLVLHGHTHYTAGYKYVPYFVDGRTERVKPIYILGTGTLGSKDLTPAQSWFHMVLLRFLADEAGVLNTVEAQPFRLSEDSLDWVSSPAFNFNLAASS